MIGTEVVDLPLRIAGEEVATGDWIEVRSPQTGELLGRAAKAGPGEVERAIAGAAEGFEETRRLPAHRRAEILRAIASDLTARRARLVEAIVGEAGKPRQYAEAEVARGLTTLALAAEEATRIAGELLPVDIEPRGEGALCVVRRFPVGPVTAITPFNFPLNLALHKVAPAIAADADDRRSPGALHRKDGLAAKGLLPPARRSRRGAAAVDR